MDKIIKHLEIIDNPVPRKEGRLERFARFVMKRPFIGLLSVLSLNFAALYLPLLAISTITLHGDDINIFLFSSIVTAPSFLISTAFMAWAEGYCEEDEELENEEIINALTQKILALLDDKENNERVLSYLERLMKKDKTMTNKWWGELEGIIKQEKKLKVSRTNAYQELVNMKNKTRQDINEDFLVLNIEEKINKE